MEATLRGRRILFARFAYGYETAEVRDVWSPHACSDVIVEFTNGRYNIL